MPRSCPGRVGVGVASRAAWIVLLAMVTAWPVSVRAQDPPPPSAPPEPAPAPAPAGTPVPMVSPYAPGGGPPVSSPYAPEWGARNTGPAAPRAVYVELRADDPRTRIDRVGGGPPIPVCVAPCLRWLDPQGTYVITGDGVRTTARFMLPDDRTSVTLDVHAGSTSRLGVGALLSGGGLITAYIGGLVWETGTLEKLGQGSGDPQRTVDLGLTLLGIGIPAALLGVYLVATCHTSVTSSTGSTFTQQAPPRRARPRVALTPRGLAF